MDIPDKDLRIQEAVRGDCITVEYLHLPTGVKTVATAESYYVARAAARRKLEKILSWPADIPPKTTK